MSSIALSGIMPKLVAKHYQDLLAKMAQSKEKTRQQVHAQVDQHTEAMYNSIADDMKMTLCGDYGIDPVSLNTAISQAEPKQKVDKVEEVKLEVSLDPSAFAAQIVQNNITHEIQVIDLDDEEEEENVFPFKRLVIDDETNTIDSNESFQRSFGNRPSIVSISLKCMRQDCALEFQTKDQLNLHMNAEHAIRPNRCHQQGCDQSFSTSDALSNHFRDEHSGLTKWNCCKCGKSFKRSSLLARHHQWMHMEGVFQCGYSSECTFTGPTRATVYAHNKLTHQTFYCAFDNCGKDFKQIGNLKRHERMHLRIKPYICGWDGCPYSSEFRSTAINHIRVQHFGLPPTVRQMKEMNIEDNRNPRDYLIIKQDLLDQLNHLETSRKRTRDY